MSKQSDVQVLSKVQSAPKGLAITQDVRMRQAQADTFARYHLAMMTPREWVEVGALLLQDCENPEFAREAYYKKPAGGGKDIEGLSIRFAEQAQRLMRNISVDTSPEMEDDYSVHYRTTVIDLESNTPTSETFKVEKTVERRYIKDGDTVISQRTNSTGDITYLVPATEDQLNTKLRAQTAKVKRGLLLAIVPADIRAKCLAKCKEVLESENAKDPAAGVKSIVSAFISIGIDVSDLKEYLGKSVQSATAAQVVDLRSLYALIRDGEMTWKDVMDAKAERESEQGSKAAFVAQKQKERDAKKAKNKPPATQPAQQSAQSAPRRGRGAAAAAAAGGDTSATTDTKPADAPPTPPKPRASRRGDDDEAPATDPASNPATA